VEQIYRAHTIISNMPYHKWLTLKKDTLKKNIFLED
jgi:hypothetical protein